MQAYDIVQRLAATSSRTDKEQIIFDAFMSGHREFFIGAQLAYDILITFGVQKVPAIAEEDLEPDDPGTFTFSDFLSLADQLRKRELTGNAAIDALRNAAVRCHGPSWNDFYRGVLRKDLGCGLTEGTINKVLKKLSSAEPEAAGLIVPTFECQLAHDGEDEKHTKKIKGEKMLDIKLDGVRLLTVLNKQEGTVTQYTRNGKVNENFTEIRAGLEKLLDKLPGSLVLDGEITGKSFQELMTQVNRQSNVKTDGAKLALFDVIPLDDFRKGICLTPQHARHTVLSNMETCGLLRETCGSLVYVIPKISVNLDTPEGRAVFNEFNREALAAKYEGIMIKDPHAPYETKRSVAWLKKKPVISVSLEVVGVDPGKPDGKRRDVMGALVLRGEDDGKEIESKCGTGFSDAQLADFWERRDSLIGMVAEIEADALTLERGETVYSLRFPRFKGWRGSVPGEKI